MAKKKSPGAELAALRTYTKSCECGECKKCKQRIYRAKRRKEGKDTK